MHRKGSDGSRLQSGHMPVQHASRQKSGDVIEPLAQENGNYVLDKIAFAYEKNGPVVAEKPAGKAGQTIQPDGLGAGNVSGTEGQLLARVQDLSILLLGKGKKAPWHPGAGETAGLPESACLPDSPFPCGGSREAYPAGSSIKRPRTALCSLPAALHCAFSQDQWWSRGARQLTRRTPSRTRAPGRG